MQLKLIKVSAEEQASAKGAKEAEQSFTPNSDFLNSLNDAQREAVITKDGPLLIVAGAGSGKTRVLTYRIAYLIQHGVKPWETLALTFTNKAAAEMKERITHICGEQAARRIWAGTFHSIFARILRMEADALGYTNTFSIYDSDDSLSVIRGVMSSLNIPSQTVSPQNVRSVISNAKNQMISWQDYANRAGDFRERQIAKVYEGYEKQLRKSNAMDFDDLLLNMIRLLESSEEMLQRYQQRFSHILVDEYQDTNRAQYIAINLLAGGHRNICVVGDDAQSIYRWRGADIRNILDFQKDYPDAAVVRLEQNYRSTKNILAAADAVIKNNRKQIPKTLWTENEQGHEIYVVSNRDDREEAERIVNIIQNEAIAHTISMREVAILYRTNAQSQAIEDALRRAGVPYMMVSGISFYKRKEVKDVTAYLRLLINPNDAESLLRVVNEPSRGIGDTSLERLRSWAAAHDSTLFEAFTRAAEIGTLMKRAQNAALDFAALVNKYREKLGELPPDELAQEYIEATGLLRAYKEQHTDEAEDRLNNIIRLLTDLAEYTLREEEPSLEAYLQQLALVSDVDEADTSQNKVAVMTLHAAKGLEFPVVIIAGVEEGLLPLVKGDAHPDEKEEERRLFYVGITRARQRLYITYAERRMKFGNVEYSRPSTFLRELPEEVVSWKGKRDAQASFERNRFDEAPSSSSYSQTPSYYSPPPKVKVPVQRSSAPAFDDIPKEENYSQIDEGSSGGGDVHLRRGMTVRHKLFGDGKVESVVGVGQNQKAIVYFPGVGRKNLMVKFARLEVVG